MSDIQELFSRDPLSLSREDLTQIVERFRASRQQFNLGNRMAGSTKPKTEKQKKIDETVAKFNIELDL